MDRAIGLRSVAAFLDLQLHGAPLDHSFYAQHPLFGVGVYHAALAQVRHNRGSGGQRRRFAELQLVMRLQHLALPLSFYQHHASLLPE